MRNWNDVEGRREAVRAYCNFMEDPANEETRAKCCSDGEFAKRQFAIIGEYYLEGETLPNRPLIESQDKPIPKAATFKVYNFEDPKRDELVVLILPRRGEPMPDPADVWRAGWEPWVS